MSLTARYRHFSNAADHTVIIVVSDRDIHAHVHVIAKRASFTKKRSIDDPREKKDVAYIRPHNRCVCYTGCVAWNYVTCLDMMCHRGAA